MRIDIACAISRSYLLPLQVLLQSVRQHLSQGYTLRLHLLAEGLSQTDWDGLARWAELRPVRAGRQQLGGVALRSPYSWLSVFPILLPEVFDNCERILFLDADLLALSDLAPLWNTDLAGKPMAAVQDMAIPTVCSPRGIGDYLLHGIPPRTPYFNAGVMLLNPRLWKRQEAGRRALDLLQSRPRDFLHQEVLNVVFWGQWLQLPARWNLIASLAGRPYSSLPLSDTPGIVHFAGRFKPWLAPVGGPFQAHYARYLRGSRLRPDFFRRCLSFYDRRLRGWMYPLERLLWRLRLI